MAAQSMLGFLGLLAITGMPHALGERIYLDQSATGDFKVVSSVDGTLGSDGVIRGAGGGGHLAVAKSSGADAIRTWGTEGLGEKLASAASHGLKVSAGIWLPHAASRYENCTDMEADADWKADFDRYLAAVNQHKNSSGLLWWTVGNEEELEVNVVAGNDCVWKRVEWIAKAVKEADPNHPVGTVMAGVAKAKVQSAFKLSPSLEFLGVNSYGDDSLKVGPQLKEWSWTKPYAIMEFGPSGHWASPQTEWGSYIEESSSQKVPRYNATCYACYDDPFCVGAFAFVWGWKWEKTGTWYNLFNEWPAVTQGVDVNCSNCQSEVLATLQKCWTGEHRSTRPPTIAAVEVNRQPLQNMSFVVDRQDDVHLSVNTSQPDGIDLVALWTVTEEVVSSAIGGAHEDTNPLLTGLWSAPVATMGTGLEVSLNTSGLAVSGEYRLYVFVRQDPSTCQGKCTEQEASASLAFKICHTAKPGEECFDHVRYAMLRGIDVHPQTYPGVGKKSSFAEVQMLLHQLREGSCPAPCEVREWCHTAVEGEECHSRVTWAMEFGIAESPESYPQLPKNANFEAVQWHLHRREVDICPRPCGHEPKGELKDDLDSDSVMSLAWHPRSSIVVSAVCFALSLMLMP